MSSCVVFLFYFTNYSFNIMMKIIMSYDLTAQELFCFVLFRKALTM